MLSAGLVLVQQVLEAKAVHWAKISTSSRVMYIYTVMVMAMDTETTKSTTHHSSPLQSPTTETPIQPKTQVVLLPIQATLLRHSTF